MIRNFRGTSGLNLSTEALCSCHSFKSLLLYCTVAVSTIQCWVELLIDRLDMPSMNNAWIQPRKKAKANCVNCACSL